MNGERKSLFRELLYWGMLDIRLATAPQGFSLNPIKIQRRRLQVNFAYEIAEWLHNLAQFSALDFEHFDESRFWQDYQIFLRKFPAEEFPAMFGRIIEELNQL